MSEPIEGKVIFVKARISCGACGGEFDVDVDPAEKGGVFDAVVQTVRGHYPTSVQGGYMLCLHCTSQCDQDVRVPIKRRANREEVREILGID